LHENGTFAVVSAEARDRVIVWSGKADAFTAGLVEYSAARGKVRIEAGKAGEEP
jgi:hypothetical protein